MMKKSDSVGDGPVPRRRAGEGPGEERRMSLQVGGEAEPSQLLRYIEMSQLDVKMQNVELRRLRDEVVALRQAKREAETFARGKNRFLANMSHELRTQMTGILGMLELALEEGCPPVPRGHVETAVGSAHSLLRMLDDILDLAKCTAGKLTFEEKPFSLAACLREAVDIFTAEARRKGLDFVVPEAAEMTATVVGDPLRLRQIFINLISNAIKFTENGRVAVGVSVGGMTADGKREFTFSVTDSGIGIPENKKDRLFRAFSQADAAHSRTFSGTGLGLAISRELVERMGGTISCNSREGAGSTFSFTLPLREASTENSARFTTRILSTSAKMAIPPHLLLVEDDPINRQLLTVLLTRANYQLDFAEDGEQAVEMWERGRYALVLMDIQMPRLDGFAATHVIREKELARGGHTPIIALTAHAFEEDQARCLAAGMDAYISKPFNFKKSLEVIGKLLGQESHSLH